MDTITEDFHRIAALLDRNAEADIGIVDFEMLDGFLCAIATAPEPIPMEAWLAEVMPEPPEDEAERDALLESLLRVHDSVHGRLAAIFEEGEDGEDPPLRIYVHGLNPDGSPVEADPDAPDADGEDADSDPDALPFAVAELWAVGFAIGVDLALGRWEESAEEWPLVDEVLALSNLLLPDPPEPDEDEDGEPGDLVESDDEGEIPPPLGAAERIIAIGELSEALHELCQLNLQRLQAKRTVRRDAPKVGRNDPCPCGSGRKYKLCHGGN